MEKKTGLTLGEHDKIGRELQIFENRLADMETIIGNAFPYTEPAYEKAGEVRLVLRELRWMLQNIALKDHGNGNNAGIVAVYERNGIGEFSAKVSFDSSTLEVRRTVD